MSALSPRVEPPVQPGRKPTREAPARLAGLGVAGLVGEDPILPAGEMPGWVADAVEAVPGVKRADVALVWDPPWGMEMLSDEARLELGFM